MYAPLYDQDTITKNYISNAVNTQVEERLDEAYITMLKSGMPIDQISHFCKVSRDKLECLMQEIVHE